MTPVVQTQFSEELLQLLKETFEGPALTGPSSFLNKGTGLFQTLDDITAEVAFRFLITERGYLVKVR